ncbi:MAG: MFS transporter [Steroidobacteraceae bacterium]
MPATTPAGIPSLRSASLALVLLSLLNLLNYFDRLLVTVVAEPVKQHFSLTDTQLGLLTGPAFIVVYIAATLVFGWLSDRRNRKNIMAAVLALWSAMTALSGFAHSYLQLAIARAGVGIGEGGSNPAALSLLSSYYPAERRGRAIAIFQSSGMVGILLTFLVGGWIAAEFGWRAAFWVAGIPGIVLAIAFFLLVPEPPRSSHSDGAVLPLGASLRLLAGNRAYRWIVIGASLAVISNLGMMQWLPLFFIRSHGLGLKQIGLFFGPVVACGMIVGMLLGGSIGDRLAKTSLSRPLTLAVGAIFLLAPLYWLVLWTPSLAGALTLTFFATATSVFYSPSITAVMLSVVQPEVRGMAAAVFNFFNGIIGQALLPFTVGVLSDALLPEFGQQSLRYALTIVVSMCLVAALAFVRAQRLTAELH